MINIIIQTKIFKQLIWVYYHKDIRTQLLIFHWFEYVSLDSKTTACAGLLGRAIWCNMNSIPDSWCALNWPSSRKSTLNIDAPLEWAIGNETCESAQRNPGYVCGGNNTWYDPDNNNGYGYRCKYKEGYDGNPYLLHGCQGTYVYSTYYIEVKWFFDILGLLRIFLLVD